MSYAAELGLPSKKISIRADNSFVSSTMPISESRAAVPSQSEGVLADPDDQLAFARRVSFSNHIEKDWTRTAHSPS